MCPPAVTGVPGARGVSAQTAAKPAPAPARARLLAAAAITALARLRRPKAAAPFDVLTARAAMIIIPALRMCV